MGPEKKEELGEQKITMNIRDDVTLDQLRSLTINS